MLPVAILAGGLAKRLRPITETIPKALVEVAGKPFVFRQLDYLHSQGIQHCVLCVGYLGEMIQAVVEDGARFGLELSYSFDGDMLLGTGGALKQAVPLLGDQFFVLYGDSFLPVDFGEVELAFFKAKKSALMTVLKNNDRWDKSNVLFRDGELLEYNKCTPRPEMKFIDYGLGVLSRRVLESYPAGQPFDLSEVYHTLSVKGQLAGFEVHERFYEIGSPSGLKETERYFLT
ncbi:MAG: nucleotidyltransferase family protein [Methylococcales bacterium]